MYEPLKHDFFRTPTSVGSFGFHEEAPFFSHVVTLGAADKKVYVIVE